MKTRKAHQSAAMGWGAVADSETPPEPVIVATPLPGPGIGMLQCAQGGRGRQPCW